MKKTTKTRTKLPEDFDLFRERSFLSDIREVEEMPIEFLKERVSREQMVNFFKREIAKIKL